MDYKKRFWDLYDNDPDAAEKLEDIMTDLDIEVEDQPDDTFALKFDDDYEAVINEYERRTGDDGEDFLDKLVDCLLNEFDDVRTFEEAGVLTMNKGVVIQDHGKEYQLSWLGSY